MRDVVRLCELDLSLVARVLSLVNSNLLGCRRPIKSLLQAMVILGVNRVRNFALISYRTDRFDRLPDAFPLKRFWSRSFSTAFISRGIVPDESGVVHEDVFLAGTLHDMGIAFLCEIFPDEYPYILARASREDVPLHELEQEAIGVQHAEIAAHVCEGWRIPEGVANVIRVHHGDTPPRGSRRRSG